jgi:hypothetical protein
MFHFIALYLYVILALTNRQDSFLDFTLSPGAWCNAFRIFPEIWANYYVSIFWILHENMALDEMLLLPCLSVLIVCHAKLSYLTFTIFYRAIWPSQCLFNVVNVGCVSCNTDHNNQWDTTIKHYPDCTNYQYFGTQPIVLKIMMEGN